jgi:copper chaperone CopZ
MDEADEYLKPRKNPTPNEDSKYLLEVGGLCPLCGKNLLANKKNDIIKLYQIAHIYPNSPLEAEKEELKGVERLGDNSESFENKIALCKDCHGTYDYHKTREEYLKILRIKKGLLKSYETQTILSNQSIEDDISDVINALANIDGDVIELEINALKISKKIEKTNRLLKNKVEGYVTHYFRYIQELLKVSKGTSNSKFDIMASQVKTAFLEAEGKLGNQNDIFNHLSKWLHTKVPSSTIEACEAVISFFIQDCEVFREITK